MSIELNSYVTEEDLAAYVDHPNCRCVSGYVEPQAAFHNPEAGDICYLPPFAPVPRLPLILTKDNLIEIFPPTHNTFSFFDNDGVEMTVAGLGRMGPIVFRTSESHARALMCESKPIAFLVHFNDYSYEFDAYVTRWDAVNDYAHVTVQPTKVITETYLSKESMTMSPKNTARPKFYVGSKKAMTPDYKGETWAKYTEKEAIAHATKLVESTGEEQFIVKIIKVVKRRPMPIVVEVVK
jgi:hypothetical protein